MAVRVDTCWCERRCGETYRCLVRVFYSGVFCFLTASY